MPMIVVVSVLWFVGVAVTMVMVMVMSDAAGVSMGMPVVMCHAGKYAFTR